MRSVLAKPVESGYTFSDYLNMEESADQKSEFEAGNIYAMAGGSLNHSAISSNINYALQNSLRIKKSACRVFESNLKVRIEEFDAAVYPDNLVLCSEPKFWNDRKDVLTNPSLIVEVLSPTTEDYDRGGKFARYRSLPSFKEYVLVSQTEPKIETWYKLEENIWRIARFEGMDAHLKLDSIDCEIALTDIYFQIDFGKTS